MADRKKHKNKKPGKLSAFVTSLLMVLCAVAYIVWGEDLAHAVGRFDYCGLIRFYGSEPPVGTVEVHMLYVGQGDCTLVRTPDGDILIDSGTTMAGDAIVAHLVACGVDSLDYFICSHPHDDHIGSAAQIIEAFPVETLLMPECTATTVVFDRLLTAIEENDVTVEFPEAGETYALGDTELRVLAPVFPSEDLNHMSLVTRLTFGETSFLFTGDAEAPSENEMLTAYFPFELDSDFLKIGHHGSSPSTSAEFLAVVSPDIVGISCGIDNEYTHPHAEVLDRLAAAGVGKILRTDRDGTFVVVSDGKTLTTYN